MSDTDHPRCQGKNCYSFREAHEIINTLKRKNHRRHQKVIPKRAYKCDVCGLWHLTSWGYYGADRIARNKRREEGGEEE